MALNYGCVAPPRPSSFFPLLFPTDSHHHPPKLQVLRRKRPKSSTQFSRFAVPPSPYTSPSHSSTTPIDDNPQPKQEPEPYPILNFFNSVQENEFDSQNGFKDEEDQLGHNIPNWNPKAEGVLGEILDIGRNVKENVTLGELLGPYEGRIGKEECVDLLGLMAQEDLVMGCLYFFKWMGLQEPSLITPQACSVLFPVLGRGGMGDALVVLVRNLPDTREFRDVHVYNAAISGLSCCGRYNDAWKIYDAIETNNVQPDDVTCSIMITIMRKSGRNAKDTWEFFQRMNRKGVEWSLESVSALIKSFCDEGLKKEALIIQIEMEKKGISSNAIVYNTLMDAYIESNQVEEAEGLFAEMKRKGIKPTSATYNILMDAYSRRMQPEIIEKLLLEMENIGLVPSARSYTSLISAYGRQRNVGDMAVNAFARMKKLGIKPFSHSYTALIQAYSVSGWHEKAFIAFENMQLEGIKPSVETYTALLDAFRRAGDPEMLMKIWKLMISEKIEGTRVTFNTLLDGFAKQGRYIEARDVICEFGKIGLQPTVMTYNMLMNAYARGGQPSKLPQLLKEMSALSLRPDSITYSTMIYAYARVRDFSRAFFYHKEMVKSGNVPDPRSYEKLRAILDVKAALKNKKDKKAVLGILNSKMGMLKSKEKGKKDEFWKNKKKQPRIHTSTRDGRR
ncbi:pentatricopeptide repeat-containing protein At5g50280, chloroplastic [Rhododendron vialii]|uniref:pentatricopeptide repeat-containing protein At5g50280, chloroplastic n=1 Tax=Rhododendron vialii TaxID=182163 RepID=UPI00265DE8A1|nr:pentatricopeptide repeat-containing protein At5g50280, chloroplastic [Rhododendron vialii]